MLIEIAIKSIGAPKVQGVNKEGAGQAVTEIYLDGTYLAHNKGWHQEDSPYKAKLVSAAIRRAALTFGSCADVGCGAGLVTELLSGEYPQSSFTGFDLSNDAMRFWTQRASRANLQYRNMDIGASGTKFDLVLCLDVFEHIEDYRGFLRSLRNTGRNFIFNIPMDMNVIKLLTSGIRLAREEVGHLHYFNSYSAIRTLLDTGYRLADVYYAAAFLSVPPRSFRQALMLPMRLASLIAGRRIASTLFGGVSLVVVAENGDASS